MVLVAGAVYYHGAKNLQLGELLDKFEMKELPLEVFPPKEY